MVTLGIVLLIIGIFVVHPLLIVGVVLLVLGLVYEAGYVRRGTERRRLY